MAGQLLTKKDSFAGPPSHPILPTSLAAALANEERQVGRKNENFSSIF